MSPRLRRFLQFTAIFVLAVSALAACTVSGTGGFAGILAALATLVGISLVGTTQTGCSMVVCLSPPAPYLPDVDGASCLTPPGPWDVDGGKTDVGPCLGMPLDADVGPCLDDCCDWDLGPDTKDTPDLGVCLSPRPEDVDVGPCLADIPVDTQDADVGPCLTDTGSDTQDVLGPCLSRLPPDADFSPCLSAPEDTSLYAPSRATPVRAQVIADLAARGVLPPDVAARLGQKTPG